MSPTQSFKRSLFVVVTLLVISILAGCNSGGDCPTEGKWTTGETYGVINFKISSCTIESLVVSFEIGNGTTTTQIFEPSCTFDTGTMKCNQENMQFSGTFDGGQAASGTVTIQKGMSLNVGGTLPKTVTLHWTANLQQ